MFWKRTFHHYLQANTAKVYKAPHTTRSSSDSRQMQLGSRTRQKHQRVAWLAIQTEDCGGERTRNALLKQRRQGEMDRGLCGKRDHCGKKASWICIDRNWPGAGWYEISSKGGIDNHQARNTIWGDVERHRRLSGRSCKFWCWGWWGRHRWWLKQSF